MDLREIRVKENDLSRHVCGSLVLYYDFLPGAII